MGGMGGVYFHHWSSIFEQEKGWCPLPTVRPELVGESHDCVTRAAASADVSTAKHGWSFISRVKKEHLSPTTLPKVCGGDELCAGLDTPTGRLHSHWTAMTFPSPIRQTPIQPLAPGARVLGSSGLMNMAHRTVIQVRENHKRKREPVTLRWKKALEETLSHSEHSADEKVWVAGQVWILSYLEWLYDFDPATQPLWLQTTLFQRRRIFLSQRFVVRKGKYI